MIIDAHQHFWQISRGDYGWMTDEVAAIRRDILPADLELLARAAGVTGTVLVQAAPTLEETLFLLDLADRTPLVRAVVGWIDLTGDVGGQLSRITHPALRGIRPMLQDIADTDWILQDRVIDGLRQVADAGLRMDALITPRHLPVIETLARRLPGLPIVVDHCAKPVFDGDPGQEWRHGITALADIRRSSASCRGWPTNTAPAGPPTPCVRSSITYWRHSGPTAHLGQRLAGAGAGRVPCRLAGHRAGADAALPEADRARIFGQTAARFYGLT